MSRRLEILAPAGGMESLKAVIAAGADAVYMGGQKFGARAFADNPDPEMLLWAIDYAHLHGIRFYLTVNTLLKERELEEELYEYLRPCYERGVDAVIVQDLGVFRAVREWFADLSIHASTQMTVTGVGGARFLKEEGADRVVLARELSLKEIKKIREEADVELECFVHGALCYCYSGQCMFSSVLGGRSGNRGRCAQPCRLRYEAKKEGQILSKKGENYLLSPKDICTLSLLPEIVEAGVYSLKIEGRMKRPEYAAGVVRIYRKYADWYLEHGADGYQVLDKDLRELSLLFNRDGFSKGYYGQHNGRGMMALWNQEISKEEKQAYETLIKELQVQYVEKEQVIPIEGTLYAKVGEPLCLKLWRKGSGQNDKVTVYGESVQEAKNRPMEEENLRKQMEKTRNTPFVWEDLTILAEGVLFVPVQALNALRRDALSKLQEKILQGYQKHIETPKTRTEKKERGKDQAWEGSRRKLHLSVETEEQLLAVFKMAESLKKEGTVSAEAVYLDAESMEESLSEQVQKIHQLGWKAYVMLPLIFRNDTAARYEKNRIFWQELLADGYVIRNLEEYDFLRRIKWKKEKILDANVYTWNQKSRQFWRERGIDAMTNPLELNSQELMEISNEDSIQVIYGRYPMMVSAGCVHQTLKQCHRQPGQLVLKDRYQKEFPVKNYCRDCYNVIYNSQPLYLLDRLEELNKICLLGYRMMFTTESRQEVLAVLKGWLFGQEAKGEFTRGHWKRGVE